MSNVHQDEQAVKPVSVEKCFIVRGKITFALGLKEEGAGTAAFQVRNGLDELTETLQDDLGLDFTVHEWEVLTEQIERSE